MVDILEVNTDLDIEPSEVALLGNKHMQCEALASTPGVKRLPKS